MIGVVDEKQHVVKLIPAVQLVEKPSRRLFRCGRKQTRMKDFVRLWIYSAVQPVILTVKADHLLVNRKLTRGHCRDRL